MSSNEKKRQYPKMYEKTLPAIFGIILLGIIVMFLVIFGVLLGVLPF